MKTRKLLALGLSAVLTLSVVLTGCGKKAANLDKDQFIVIPMTDDVNTLDLSKATDLYSADVLTEVMEGLTRVESDGTKDIIAPAGAKSWDMSKDGLTWTFHLRDYNWTDGVKVTAKDYVYSWLRLLDPNTASEYAYFLYVVKNGKEFNAGKAKAEDVGVKAVDDNTFQVTLAQPVPYFLTLTPFKNLFPLRKDSVDKGGEKYGSDPKGVIYNGPFVIDEWQKGTKVVLKKNPTYWDEKAVKLNTVTLQIVAEDAARMKLFLSKGLDFAGAKGEYLTKFKKQAEAKEFGHRTGFLPSTSYVFFNVEDKSKLFTNAKVRLAFSLAIDREAYVKLQNRYTPAYGWAPFSLTSGSKEFRKEVKEPLKEVMKKNTDPKALLQEGLKELGMDPNAPIELTFLSAKTDTVTRTNAEFYQNQWQTKLGVKIKLDATNGFPQFQARTKKGEFQIAAQGWTGDYNDPMTFFDMFITGSGNNDGKWSNKEYDDLIKQVEKVTDFSKRTEIFKKCEQLLVADDAAIAPVFYADKNTFIHNYLKGLQQPLFGTDFEIKYAYTEGRQ